MWGLCASLFGLLALVAVSFWFGFVELWGWVVCVVCIGVAVACLLGAVCWCGFVLGFGSFVV